MTPADVKFTVVANAPLPPRGKQQPYSWLGRAREAITAIPKGGAVDVVGIEESRTLLKAAEQLGVKIITRRIAGPVMGYRIWRKS